MEPQDTYSIQNSGSFVSAAHLADPASVREGVQVLKKEYEPESLLRKLPCDRTQDMSR